MAEKKTFNAGEIIFREGQWADYAYEIAVGRVGIFANYGAADQVELTTLVPGRFFGEMGVLDGTARSATAVALDDGTELAVYDDAGMKDYFAANPDKLLAMFRNTSSRLRDLSRDYVEACGTIADYMDEGGHHSQGLLSRIFEMIDVANDYANQHPEYMSPYYWMYRI